MGFRSLTAVTTCRSTLDPGHPRPGKFRPRRFARPRRFTPPAGSRPFSGRCRSQGSPCRAFFLPGSRTPLGVVPLMPFPATAFLHSEVVLDEHGSPRLQSIAPPVESAPRRAAARPTGRCSHGIHSLQGSRRSATADAPAGLPPCASDLPRHASGGALPAPRGIHGRSGQGVRRRTTDPPGIFHLVSP